MRRFLASAWYPFLVCLVLAGATVGAFSVFGLVTYDIGNAEVQRYVGYAGWAAGPAVGLLSFVAIGILNVVRRIIRLRKTKWLHPVIVLLGVVPWVVCAWILAGEPAYTPIGRAVVPFVARPLLWGSLAATLFTLFLSLPIFFQRRR